MIGFYIFDRGLCNLRPVEICQVDSGGGESPAKEGDTDLEVTGTNHPEALVLPYFRY